MSTQDKSAELPVVAWRYEDSRGHYRYRGPAVDFDKKYAILKPIALTDQAQATARIQELQAEHDEALRLRDVNEKVAAEWRDAAKDLSNQVQELQAQVAALSQAAAQTLDAVNVYRRTTVEITEESACEAAEEALSVAGARLRALVDGALAGESAELSKDKARLDFAEANALAAIDAIGATKVSSEPTGRVLEGGAIELSPPKWNLRAAIDDAMPKTDTGAQQTQGGA